MFTYVSVCVFINCTNNCSNNLKKLLSVYFRKSVLQYQFVKLCASQTYPSRDMVVLRKPIDQIFFPMGWGF